MAQDWHNPEVARHWDAQSNATNPVRREQLDILVTLVSRFIQPGNWLVDLGYGSGQVEQLLFDRSPDVHVVGVDSSAEMMKLASDRLADHVNQFESISHDLASLTSLSLPNHPYQFVIAIQSLHHLSKAAMRAAYDWIYQVLEPGGMFLLLDRLRVENDGVFEVMREVWLRQDDVYGSCVAPREGETFDNHERIVRDRGDYPVLLDEHLAWLKGSGFQAACLHLHGNRALIAGRKG